MENILVGEAEHEPLKLSKHTVSSTLVVLAPVASRSIDLDDEADLGAGKVDAQPATVAAWGSCPRRRSP